MIKRNFEYVEPKKYGSSYFALGFKPDNHEIICLGCADHGLENHPTLHSLGGKVWDYKSITPDRGYAYDICYSEKLRKWFAVGQGEQNAWWSSADDYVWHNISFPMPITEMELDFCVCVNDIFITGCYDNKNKQSKMWYSDNLITWTEVNLPGGHLVGMDYNGSVYVGITKSCNVLYSSDLITWKLANIDIVAGKESLVKIAWNGKYFMIAGNTHVIWKSLDGINWSKENPAIFSFVDSCQRLKAYNGKFYYLSTHTSVGGLFVSDPDGNNWENISFSVSAGAADFIIDADKIIILVNNGSVYYSDANSPLQPAIPKIIFTPLNSTIKSGDPVTLSWSVTGAYKVDFETRNVRPGQQYVYPIIDTVGMTGNKTVKPILAGNTYCVINAYGVGGENTAAATITIPDTTNVPLQIKSFIVNGGDHYIELGVGFTAEWEIVGATSVKMNGIPVSINIKQINCIPLLDDADMTLEAWGVNGQYQKSEVKLIAKKPNTPKIENVIISRQKTDTANHDVIVSWKINNNDMLWIDINYANGTSKRVDIKAIGKSPAIDSLVINDPLSYTVQLTAFKQSNSSIYSYATFGVSFQEQDPPKQSCEDYWLNGRSFIQKMLRYPSYLLCKISGGRPQQHAPIAPEPEALKITNTTISYVADPIAFKNPYNPRRANCYKTQLHCHSTESNKTRGAGEAGHTPLEQVQKYKEYGYSVVQLTDHDIFTQSPSIDGCIGLRGVEETCNQPDQGGHIGAYRVTSTIPSMDAQIVINQIIAQGGFASLNHPNCENTAMWTPAKIDKLDGYKFVEVYNRIFETKGNVEGSIGDNGYADDIVDYIASKYPEKDIRLTAVDDCHWWNSDFVGMVPPHADQQNHGAVWVYADELTENAIYQSLFDGNFYAAKALEIKIDITGNSIKVDCVNGTNCKFEWITKYGVVQKLENGVSSIYVISGNEGYIRCKVTGVKICDALPSMLINQSAFAWTQIFKIN